MKISRHYNDTFMITVRLFLIGTLIRYSHMASINLIILAILCVNILSTWFASRYKNNRNLAYINRIHIIRVKLIDVFSIYCLN